MVRWRTFQKLFVIGLAVLLGFMGRTAFAGAKPASEPAFHKANLPVVASTWLGKNQMAVVELVFDRGAVDLRYLQLAINGIRARAYPGRIERLSRWERRGKQWVLTIEIGDLIFGTQSFSGVIADIQRRNGKASLWISPAAGLFSARLYFVARKKPLPPKAKGRLPVEITRTIPAESPTNSDKMTVEFRRNRPWFTGYTECRLDSGAFSSCQSPVQLTNLTSGDHAFEVRLVRRFWIFRWFSHPDRHEWTVIRRDIVAEWVSTPPELTGDTTALFEFRADGASRFECTLDGRVSSCQSPWKVTNLEDGSHVASVTAFDDHGTASAPIEHRWRVDTEAPVLEITSIMPQQNPTSLNRLAVSYTLSEPSAVKCFLDGAELGACASPVLLESLQEGSHQLVLVAMDSVGNEADPVTYEWDVDLTLPTVSIELVEPTSLPTRQSTARFHLIPSEIATFRCALDSSAPTSCSNDVTLSGLGHGLHELFVTPIDVAGNEGETASFRWAVDQVAPQTQLVSVQPPEAVTTETSIHLEFESSEPASFTCNLDGAGAAACTSPFIANGLADGLHRLTIGSTDPAGNVGAPFVYEWRVASIALVSLTSITPSELLTNQNSIRFDFTSQRATGFECSLDAAAFVLCSTPAIYSALADGNHRFEVRALNDVGAPGPSVSHQWTVDTIAPTVGFTQIIPSAAVTTSRTKEIHFAASEANATFLCRLDAAAEQSCASPLRWENLADGDHVFQVWAVDISGNRSFPSTHNWRIQSAPLSVSASVQQVTNTTAVIRWSANFPARGFVEYGLGNAFNLRTPEVLPAALNQSTQLTGLVPDSLYRARVRITDIEGRTAVSATVSFTTQR